MYDFSDFVEKMITPRFQLSQDDDFLYISIYAPFTNLEVGTKRIFCLIPGIRIRYILKNKTYFSPSACILHCVQCTLNMIEFCSKFLVAQNCIIKGSRNIVFVFKGGGNCGEI